MRPRSSRLVRGRNAEPLGREVEQVELAGEEERLDHPAFVEVLRGVEEARADAERGERVDLVLHERDQRGDDDADARAHQRRDLVAERLAAAGRHEHDRVAARADVVDDLRLLAAEVVVAEHAPQDVERRGRGVGEHGPDGRPVPRRETRRLENRGLAVTETETRREWGQVLEARLARQAAWSSANSPPSARSRAGLPSSTTRPSAMTSTRSAISTVDSRWAMIKRRAVGQHRLQRRLHRPLARHVQRRRGLVEQHHRRVGQHHPGQRHELPLARRQPPAALAHVGVEPVGQRLDERARPHGLRRPRRPRPATRPAAPARCCRPPTRRTGTPPA